MIGNLTKCPKTYYVGVRDKFNSPKDSMAKVGFLGHNIPDKNI